MTDLGIELAERGLLPDALVRLGIRRLLTRQLAEAARGGPAERARRKEALVARLERDPIAVHTADANAQHYEVPAGFYRHWLGPRLKYSACLWEEGVPDLAAAEEAMLALYAERAALADGQRILDLGCGWGSFTLWAAERFPAARLLAVSNSAGQRAFIEGEAARRGLANVEVRTADANAFEPSRTFDRVVSVEMLEHVRNHAAMFERIARWLEPGGLLFVHVFTHRDLVYLYETEGRETWMARHFFTGGIMPSHDLLPRHQRHLALEADWRVDGRHYQRTLEAWLANLDRAREAALRELADGLRAVGRPAEPAALRRQLQRWRIFLMACAELFGYAGGSEWGVSHYRFVRR
jgi:cyclopropane-fatty-acyl-phospholipid synthase